MIHRIRLDSEQDKLEHLNSLLAIPSINPKDYNEDGDYQRMDFIMHAEYGAGFITEILSNQEVKAFFPCGEKTLSQKQYITQ